MKKEFIFLGPPACGKGTQTTMLAEYMKFPHVDTGSLLRAEIAANTNEGKEAKLYIDEGHLVPVELVAKIIKNRLSETDCQRGYILDGYPRSLEQANSLTNINNAINENTETDFKAIYFDIDTDILIDRIVNRRSCPKCGEIYNLVSKAPKIEGVCDKCGTELTRRKDDTREIAQERFDTYFKETEPLVEYYKNMGVLKTIDANGNISVVWERLLKVVND